MIKKFNISKPEKYVKNGEEKTMWHNVGTLTHFEKDGKISRIIEIPAIGLKANVFEFKKDENKGVDKKFENYGKDDVAPEDIPF